MAGPEASKAQNAALFNGLAPDYDAAGPGAFAHFGQRLVALIGVAPGQRVLDVATGRGAVLFPAAAAVGDAGEVVGIDLAERMVDATREEAARRGVKADLRVMDAEQLDFPDASFDQVFCGFGVMFFPNLDGTLGEFRRVLKPGGRLGISTWRVSETEDLGAVLDELGLQPGRPPGWITEPEALRSPLIRAGFTDVRVEVAAETFRYADLEQYWQTALGTARRRVIDTLEPAQREQVRARLAERLRPHQCTDGYDVEAVALLAVATR
jgi:ubiquinone/menaquinone biosynthesis C-methylase UbiE